MHTGVICANVHTLNAPAAIALSCVFSGANGRTQYVFDLFLVDAAGVADAQVGKIALFTAGVQRQAEGFRNGRDLLRKAFLLLI